MKPIISEIAYHGTTKEYLMALYTNINFVKLLNSEGRPYSKVFKWLIENDTQEKEEERRPLSIKEIAAITQLQPSKVTQHIKDIYNDILLLNVDMPEKFAEKDSVICNLYFNYLGRRASFSLGLRTIPRKDESFHFSFINPIMGGDAFYIKNVDHIISNNRQTVSIRLTHEEPFLYLELLKQKMYLKDWLSYEDYYLPTTEAIQKELLKTSL